MTGVYITAQPGQHGRTDISIRRLLGGRIHADNQQWFCVTQFLVVLFLIVFPSFSILFDSCHPQFSTICLFGWESSPIECLGPLETTGDGKVSNEADSNNYNYRQRVAKTNPRLAPAIKQLKPLASQHSINCPISPHLPVPDKISSQLSLRCLCFCGRGITPKTGSTPPLFSKTDFHTFHNKVKFQKL